MRDINFTSIAFNQYNTWQIENKTIFNKIKKLIIETTRTPFDGIGKPEALKHGYSGYWSRRITDEHRLVYRVEATYIKIVSCKFHY